MFFFLHGLFSVPKSAKFRAHSFVELFFEYTCMYLIVLSLNFFFDNFKTYLLLYLFL